MVNFQNGVTPINDTNLNKAQTDLQINMIVNQEIPTNIFYNGEQVYMKRVDCGNLPNDNIKYINHGITNKIFIKSEGFATKDTINNEEIYPLNYLDVVTQSNSTTYSVGAENIIIITWGDKSLFKGYVDIYYTKRN